MRSRVRTFQFYGKIVPMLTLDTIDIKENQLLKINNELLSILLKDKTSNKNIIWATENYENFNPRYSYGEAISIESITGHNGNIIKPRIQKSKQEQQNRIRLKAEVFTPSWICNIQNNLVDNAWFSGKQLFNIEIDGGWETLSNKINFSSFNKQWQEYVSTKRIEMACGEAPYITSRYDTVTGVFIPVDNRIGFLDRKLRVINENTECIEDWLKWAYIALTSVYGFEWQGDNILIARENTLFTIAEHFLHKFETKLEVQDLVGFAKVIAWNIWQMDGIKYVIPNSCSVEEKKEETLFGSIVTSVPCEGCKTGNKLKHNGIFCTIKDWETRHTIRFVDLVKG